MSGVDFFIFFAIGLTSIHWIWDFDKRVIKRFYLILLVIASFTTLLNILLNIVALSSFFESDYWAWNMFWKVVSFFLVYYIFFIYFGKIYLLGIAPFSIQLASDKLKKLPRKYNKVENNKKYKKEFKLYKFYLFSYLLTLDPKSPEYTSISKLVTIASMLQNEKGDIQENISYLHNHVPKKGKTKESAKVPLGKYEAFLEKIIYTIDSFISLSHHPAKVNPDLGYCWDGIDTSLVDVKYPDEINEYTEEQVIRFHFLRAKEYDIFARYMFHSAWIFFCIIYALGMTFSISLISAKQLIEKGSASPKEIILWAIYFGFPYLVGLDFITRHEKSLIKRNIYIGLSYRLTPLLNNAMFIINGFIIVIIASDFLRDFHVLLFDKYPLGINSIVLFIIVIASLIYFLAYYSKHNMKRYSDSLLIREAAILLSKLSNEEIKFSERLRLSQNIYLLKRYLSVYKRRFQKILDSQLLKRQVNIFFSEINKRLDLINFDIRLRGSSDKAKIYLPPLVYNVITNTFDDLDKFGFEMELLLEHSNDISLSFSKKIFQIFDSSPLIRLIFACLLAIISGYFSPQVSKFFNYLAIWLQISNP